VPDNLVDTPTIDSQPQMLGAMEQSSPIPIKVLVNGGVSNSTDLTILIELESVTEETAAEVDLPELRSLLVANFVDKFKTEQETINGTLLNAQDLYWVA
jgi:hypothetical protein